MKRATHTTIINQRGGCTMCAGLVWSGANAVAMAARHHDRTRHKTWAEQTQRIEYGGTSAKSRQERLL